MKFVLLALLARDQLPDAPGKAAVEKVCGACHPAEVIIGMRLDRQGWKELVDEMIFKGAVATPRERAQIVAYLAKHFPGTASLQALPSPR